MNVISLDLTNKKHQREIANAEMDGSSRLMLARTVERQMRALTILKSLMGGIIGRNWGRIIRRWRESAILGQPTP